MGGKSMCGRVKLATYLSISLIACGGGAYAQQQVIGAPPEASNMRLVGANDLQARSAYQPTIIIRATAGLPISDIMAAPTTFPRRSIR
jgi:hypothetical protein